MTQHETRISIGTDVRGPLVTLINARLADAIDLYTQVKHAHWNVKGSDFIQLHEMFDVFAGALVGHIDTMAERATTLGGQALGTARRVAADSTLEEFPADAVDGRRNVVALAERYSAFGARLREAIDDAAKLGDMDLADIFTEVSRDVDKHLWFLEAHLQA